MSFTAYLWTLFTSAFVSSTVLPGGSEALVVYGMHEFQTQLWVVVFVATAGNTLGALVTYGMGRLIPNISGTPIAVKYLEIKISLVLRSKTHAN